MDDPLPLRVGAAWPTARFMARLASNDWLEGTGRRPPALVLLVIVVAVRGRRRRPGPHAQRRLAPEVRAPLSGRLPLGS